MSGTSVVAVVSCQDYDASRVVEAVREGFSLLGEAAVTKLLESQPLLLKPNLLMPAPAEKGVTTHPAVFGAVARHLLGLGARMTWGDSPNGVYRPEPTARRCGLTEVAQAIGIPMEDFDLGTEAPFPGGVQNRRFEVAGAALRAGAIVNLPRLKTHGSTVMTGALKNSFGLVTGNHKMQFHLRHTSVEDFSRKAQLAAYEDARAKFEAYATHWSNRKMVINWMLNNHWPSFFGHLFDYYFKQGGGYFGAKKALQPASVVWDYYATGDRSRAHLYAVNQQLDPLNNVNVTVRFYNLDGTQAHFAEAKNLSMPSSSSVPALTVGRISGLSAVYFVRCQMRDAAGKVLAENVYWESQLDDDLGPASNDDQFAAKWVQLGDLSALNTMPAARVGVSGAYEEVDGETHAHISLRNKSEHVAFFVRTEITMDSDGGEVLPIRYDDNYITVFPRETRTMDAVFLSSLLAGHKPALRLEGYDVPKQVVPLRAGAAK